MLERPRPAAAADAASDPDADPASIGGPADAVACPRCGFDVRGVMTTWQERCPLAGTCSECGLEFAWGDVLDRRRRWPRWCPEGGRGVGSYVVRLIAAMAVALWPWRFWSSLQMTHRIRWARLVLAVPVCLLATYLLFCVAQALYVTANWQVYMILGGGSVGLGDVWRVALLPLADSAPPPFAGFSGLTPRHLSEFWGGPAVLAALAAAVQLLCPLTFIALPVSRRRARVRWAHIFRVAVYGLALLAPGVLLMLVGGGLHRFPRGSTVLETLAAFGGMCLVVAAVWAVAFPFLLVAWWATATGRYLRIPHAWGVGVVVVVMAILLCILLIALVSIVTGMAGP